MSVRSSLHGHVAVVEIVAPPHNLLDADLTDALATELEMRAAEDGCRAIVLASEGRSFCAGGRFAQLGGDASTAEAFAAGASVIYGHAARIFSIGVPIVAAVHGAAIGAGLGLALACDVRVASSDAYFHGNFVRLGIHPGFAVSVTLPALVGPSRASEMLLTGRRVGAHEALEWGLTDRVVEPARVRTCALEVAEQIAAAAPLAVAATRATLRAGLAERARNAMRDELAAQKDLIATADAAEGVAAMLDGREPRFSGR